MRTIVNIKLRKAYVFNIGLMFVLNISLFAQMDNDAYLKKIPFNKCYSTDKFTIDTIPSMVNNYLEINVGNGVNKKMLLQARSYQNSDSTVLTVVTGLYQNNPLCDYYNTRFFEYSFKTGIVTGLDEDSILPKLSINAFIRGRV